MSVDRVHRDVGDVGDRLPPGQHLSRGWPVLHYGRVPRFDPQRWDLQVGGEVHGEPQVWTWPQFQQLPMTDLVADLHCVTKFSVLGNVWRGVAGATLLDLVPPAEGVRHVLVSAEYGYSANMRLADFAQGLLATELDGAPLTAERGFPVRLVVPHLYGWKGPKWVRAIDYLTEDRRGFWEERGYHNRGGVWAEQRFSHQEASGEGPPLASPG